MPCLHDEPEARLDIFGPLFSGARGVWFLSEPERDLARELYQLPPRHDVLGSRRPRARRATTPTASAPATASTARSCSTPGGARAPRAGSGCSTRSPPPSRATASTSGSSRLGTRRGAPAGGGRRPRDRPRLRRRRRSATTRSPPRPRTCSRRRSSRSRARRWRRGWRARCSSPTPAARSCAGTASAPAPGSPSTAPRSSSPRSASSTSEPDAAAGRWPSSGRQYVLDNYHLGRRPRPRRARHRRLVPGMTPSPPNGGGSPGVGVNDRQSRILMVSPYPPIRDGIGTYAAQEVKRLLLDGPRRRGAVAPAVGRAPPPRPAQPARRRWRWRSGSAATTASSSSTTPTSSTRTPSGRRRSAAITAGLIAMCLRGRNVELRLHEFKPEWGGAATRPLLRRLWLAARRVEVHTETEKPPAVRGVPAAARPRRRRRPRRPLRGPRRRRRPRRRPGRARHRRRTSTASSPSASCSRTRASTAPSAPSPACRPPPGTARLDVVGGLRVEDAGYVAHVEDLRDLAARHAGRAAPRRVRVRPALRRVGRWPPTRSCCRTARSGRRASSSGPGSTARP